jgi:hypothetical protein
MASSSPVLSTTNDTRDYAVPADAPAPPLPPCEPRRARHFTFRRIAELVRHMLETSNYDTSFQRPDVIEDDYFRFRHQPRD